MQATKLNLENTLTFITGGNATFTIRSLKTGTRFTYKVTAPADKDKDASTIYFVSTMTGSDNESNFSYIGFIKQQGGVWRFFYGNKARLSNTATCVVAFEWAFNRIISPGVSTDKIEVWHEGCCCRCGRKLTVPESIETGIGPECNRIKIKKQAA